MCAIRRAIRNLKELHRNEKIAKNSKYCAIRRAIKKNNVEIYIPHYGIQSKYFKATQS